MFVIRRNTSRSALFRIVVLHWIVASTSIAYTSDPTADIVYSDRENLCGFEFSEEAARLVLAESEGTSARFECLLAAISVIGELRYTGLTSELKAIYYRRPEDVSPRHLKLMFSTGRGGSKHWIQAHVTRALLRCGDPDAEELALQGIMQVYTMSLVPAMYTVRNIKFLVQELGRDVSNEIEFLCNQLINHTANVTLGHAILDELLKEFDEIIEYARLTSSPHAQKYSDLFIRLRDTAPSDAALAFKRVELRRAELEKWQRRREESERIREERQSRN